jgi:hypothetical protein
VGLEGDVAAKFDSTSQRLQRKRLLLGQEAA